MAVKQYFDAQGVYLGAMEENLAPQGAIESPQEIYDARSTLNTSTNVVTVYTDPGTIPQQISDEFDKLDAAGKTKMRPYITEGFVALSIPNMPEVSTIFTEAAGVANAAPSLEATFISEVQSILGIS